MLQVIITSSVLILVLAALQRLLRGKIPLRLQYALWLIAAVRLLVPVSVGSLPVSVLNALPDTLDSPIYVSYTGDIGSAIRPEPSQTDDAAAVAAQSASQTVRPGVRILTQLPQEDELPANTTVISLFSLLKPLWITGMAVMALWFALVNLDFHRRLRRTARPLNCSGCPLPVFVAEDIPSPCLAGLFRPAICVTPACLEDEERLRHVLAHELTHWKHGDPLWSLVRCLCLAVHWFNPLVWLAASLSRRDCELACDEGALARLGEEQRTTYGRTLIGLIALSSSPAHLLQTATTMVDRRRGLKERLTLIAQKPRTLAAAVVAVVLITAVTAACTFTGAEAGPEQDGNVQTNDAPLTQSVPLNDESLSFSNVQDLLDYLAGQSSTQAFIADTDWYNVRGDAISGSGGTCGIQSFNVPPDVIECIIDGLAADYSWSSLGNYPTPNISETGWRLVLVPRDFSFYLSFYPGLDRVSYCGGSSQSFEFEVVPAQSGGIAVADWIRAQIDVNEEDPS